MPDFKKILKLIPSLTVLAVGMNMVIDSRHHAVANLFEASELFDIQKVRYLNQEWSSFFGTAQAYRMKFLKSDEYSKMVMLEILALIKICRFNDAIRLCESLGKALTSSLKKSNEQFVRLTDRDEYAKIVDAIERLELLAQAMNVLSMIPRNAVTTKSESNKVEILWPNNEQLMHVIDVKSFRVKVHSLCEQY